MTSAGSESRIAPWVWAFASAQALVDGGLHISSDEPRATDSTDTRRQLVDAAGQVADGRQ
jgi:hypothetical protein